MFRVSYLLTILAVVALAFGATVYSNPATAQEDSSIPPDHPMIGAWRSTVTDAGEEFQTIDIFSADGTVISVDPLVFAVEPDFVIFETPALGAWEATGDNSGAFTAEYFSSDGQGNFAGIVTISGTRQTSDDGQTATGEFAYSVVDPAGNVIVAGQGTDESTRIAVVPMESLATPAATPAT